MNQKSHEYKMDNVVIGNNIHAIVYAFINNYPIIYTKLFIPLDFEYLNPSLDLSFCNIKQKDKILKGINSSKVVGIPEKDFCFYILFLLFITALTTPLASTPG
jgi:hypothetical protein